MFLHCRVDYCGGFAVYPLSGVFKMQLDEAVMVT